jgi:chaperonin cofactor prefoldin
MTSKKVIDEIDEALSKLSSIVDDDSIVLITGDQGVFVHVKNAAEMERKDIKEIEERLSKHVNELLKIFKTDKVSIDKLPEELSEDMAYMYIKSGHPVTDGENYYLQLNGFDVYLKISEELYRKCIAEGPEVAIDHLDIPNGDDAFIVLKTLVTLKGGEKLDENRQE